ncbi:Ubiquitin-like protein ATG12 [Penicillium sp. IBT 18751x]|nr:Ubiquitin-like protein ATG12 [Penicillium sp. IBT 18751x]
MDSSSPLERSAQNSSGNQPGSSTLPHRPSPGRQSQRTGSDSPSRGDGPIPDDNHGADLPMNMSASVMLTGLPRDAHQALADVEAIDAGKVTVRFQPLPSAPILKNRVFKISASQKFETVVKFLRKKLDCKDTDSVFCYVNSVFAPGLDEGVGGLWRCFKTDDQLIVAYSMTPAFG